MAKGVLEIANVKTGHDTTEWNTEVPETVSLAEQLFNKAIEDGTKFAVATANDGEREITRTFDPEAARIYVSNRLVGG